jgi:hypothetical protein
VRLFVNFLDMLKSILWSQKLINSVYWVILFLFVWVQAFGADDAQKTLVFESDTWPVFTTQKAGTKVCFMSAIPVKSEGNFQKRSAPYIVISTKDSENFTVIATSGYSYSQHTEGASSMVILPSKASFSMQIAGETALVVDAKMVETILQSLKPASSIVLEGKSHAGSRSKDSFSLVGFTKSFEELKKACQAEVKPATPSAKSTTKKPTKDVTTKKPTDKKRAAKPAK